VGAHEAFGHLPFFRVVGDSVRSYRDLTGVLGAGDPFAPEVEAVSSGNMKVHAS